MIETNSSLKAFNTFAIEARTHTLFYLKNRQQLATLSDLVKQFRAQALPVLILGAGSNILFCEDFSGLVIKVELMGVEITEDNDDYLIQVAAGENWHQLVTTCIDRGIGGLENLALIPGVVGAAPVQNIGAYGSEFKDVCESVEYIDLPSGEFFNLSTAACQFAYRDSIFKHPEMDNALITKVTLRLPKKWQAYRRDGAVQTTQTAKQIFQSICATRSQKLPDPADFGNAGSFFKNPLVDSLQAERLLHLYPTMPHYPQTDGAVKLAAGWLIEQAGLKGKKCGGAAVYQQQALVLINQNNASAADIIELAELVRSTVDAKFNISLEHEVRFIDRQGETNLQRVSSHVCA